MAQPNLVSLNITEADLTEIKAAINVLTTKLLPHLKTLSPEDRMELPKMGNKTISFVQKTIEHCEENPELVPNFMDVAELTTDFQSVEALRVMYQPLLRVTEGLSDTIILAGSEAFSGALMFYNSIKNAMKSKIQKAEGIYKDLSARFPGFKKKDNEPIGA